MIVLGLYRCLLALHPPEFRREFEAEMVTVFEEACAQYATRSLRAYTAFVLRDLSGVAFHGLARNHRLQAALIALLLAFALHLSLFSFLVPIPGKAPSIPPAALVSLAIASSGLARMILIED